MRVPLPAARTMAAKADRLMLGPNRNHHGRAATLSRRGPDLYNTQIITKYITKREALGCDPEVRSPVSAQSLRLAT